ncbi:hypothetical protein RCO22_08280 [Pseudomonas yamanorum]|uniref:Uncharacterized protein n=1 Tax=Pseudomonas yamanorum TaxID=515393 RepID=A0ABU1CNV0_9PSED|nr:hypothetical protein [Pseudomonas yamanorum]MDR0188935.1 hypothetical protein [Pseudomonas yamanorum]
MAERVDIDTVIIAGHLRKRDGVVLGVDSEQLERATDQSREHLFRAAGCRQDPFVEHFFPLPAL